MSGKIFKLIKHCSLHLSGQDRLTGGRHRRVSVRGDKGPKKV